MAVITGELRAWADEFPLHGGPLACVLACADRIDERHEDELGAARAKAEAEYDGWYPPCEVEGMRRFAERLEAAAAERADVTLFGVDYTPLELVKEHLANRCMTLPLDADGIPVHVGDVMEERSGHTFEAASLMAFGGSDNWLVLSDPQNFSSFREPHDIRHHHAPTVEDVLEEFVARWMETHHDDIPALKAEYAARLRLAGDE